MKKNKFIHTCWFQKMNTKYLKFCYVLITWLLPLAIANSYHLKQIPAIYVFGDSLVDSGNNNYLPIKSNAKFLPYGIDFGAKPTGRYSNGKTLVDYLGQKTQLTFTIFACSVFHTTLTEN